jgi:hypothetical protein
MGAVNTTYTFAANDTITSAKMNNIIDQTTMTGDAIFGTTLEIVSGQLKVRAQGITSNELAAGSVTSNVIADGTIVNADISPSAAIEPSKLGTGAIPVTVTVTTGNVVDGSITAPKLNGAQTGNPPIYGARAFGTVISNGTALAASKGNVSEVTRLSTGQYRVSFANNMPTTDYSVVVTTMNATGAYFFASVHSKSAASFTIACAYRDFTGDFEHRESDVSFIVIA